MNVSWDGPEPKERTACPYPVYFECKPAPADSLNSLESGRLLIKVDLGGGVKSVSVKITNNAKSHVKILEQLQFVEHENLGRLKVYRTTPKFQNYFGITDLNAMKSKLVATTNKQSPPAPRAATPPQPPEKS